MKDTVFITIFGWVLCIFSWLICAPMTYFFIQLYQKRNNICIYKRYPVTTFITYIVVLIDVLLQKPFFVMYQMNLFNSNSYILLFISLGLLPFVYYGFTYSILWKFYLLFYEINHSKEAMNDGWKNIINPQSGTKSFFLEHHDTYGNFHWISIRFIIATMICITTSYLLWILGMIEWLAGSYKFFRIATSVDLFLISLPLILMVYMYFRIPSFYDYFHVRIELRITFIILCIYYIAIVFVQLEIIWLNIFGRNTINSRLFSLIHTLITIICQFSIILIQTKWTLNKLEPYLKIKWDRTKSKIQMQEMVIKASEHNDQMDKQTDINTKANTNTIQSNENMYSDEDIPVIQSDIQIGTDNTLTMRDILSKNQAFDAFMLHINKEFSVEILLSYVEITQFLQYLFNNFDDMISSEVHDVEINETLIDFPSSVPESYIIATATRGAGSMRKMTGRKQSKSKEHQNSVKTKEEVLLLVEFIGSSLYNKYVKHNCDLEINISSTLRKKFTNTLTGHDHTTRTHDPLKMDKVIQLFCDCNKAMYKLLGYSFSRFTAKKDFDRLCEMSVSTARSASNAHKLTI